MQQARGMSPVLRMLAVSEDPRLESVMPCDRRHEGGIEEIARSELKKPAIRS